jgi:mannose-6-phosphate isomerase-like protein (cupin superfamily)
VKVVEKPWGQEEWWAEVPDRYLGKTIRVFPTRRLSLQYHKDKHETIKVMSGYGIAELGDAKIELTPGVVVDVPPGVLHRFTNTGTGADLVLLEVSTYHPEDVVRVEDDFGR